MNQHDTGTPSSNLNVHILSTSFQVARTNELGQANLQPVPGSVQVYSQYCTNPTTKCHAFVQEVQWYSRNLFNVSRTSFISPLPPARSRYGKARNYMLKTNICVYIQERSSTEAPWHKAYKIMTFITIYDFDRLSALGSLFELQVNHNLPSAAISNYSP